MSAPAVRVPKKLIETAIPLDSINEASAREKSIRHGHPSTLHLWWARRPLAAARAVIFAQLVNDPGFQHGQGWRYGVKREAAAVERERLFAIMRDLVLWENSTNEQVLEAARAEIRKSWRDVCELNKKHPEAATLFDPEKLPGLHDPFAGGGSIPLEAQRLGLEAFASDLNPVAVLINKAMIEIPPRFAGRAPVHPEVPKRTVLEDPWKGAEGLAEDVRRYGAWMRDKAQKRIGHLYPKVRVTKEMVAERPDLKDYAGEELTVIAWLWARTVASPNPAFSDVHVPLASTFVLSSKEGKEAWVEPIVEGKGYRFEVRVGTPSPEAKNGTKLARGANFRCVLSGTPLEGDYIKAEGCAKRMGQRLMAIVAEGKRGRVYLAPNEEHEAAALRAIPEWAPDLKMPPNPRWFSPPDYGMPTYGDLFTNRQLVALTTFSDLVGEAMVEAKRDAIAAGLPDDDVALEAGGRGSRAYAEAVATYLAFAVDKVSNTSSTVTSWMSDRGAFRETFARQAIPMVWDFAEANNVGGGGGTLESAIEKAAMAVASLPAPTRASARQSDAQTQTLSINGIVSTDPPYYDNIGYADLSDYFYVWLRRSLGDVFTNVLATRAVPKDEELVATPYRHGSKNKAEAFFLEGMTTAFANIAKLAHPAAPVTIYYAFKQSETKDDDTANTGWETFLEAVLASGFAITGTWPVRTEGAGRLIGLGSNALASSIVLVCRKRDPNAPTIARRAFIRELSEVLPEALSVMTAGAGGDQSPVAPVDLSQAILGPGMAVFSKYAAVLEADGSPMRVKTALQLINRYLADDDFDADTQFCLAWFDEHGFEPGAFGQADVLARAKATSVSGVVEAGVLEASGGKVRLLPWTEYPTDWDPRTDTRLPVWEALHHLIRVLRTEGSSGAGPVLAALSDRADTIRQLAYRMYTLQERRGAAEEARAYNELIGAWDDILEAAKKAARPAEKQAKQLSILGGDA